MPDRELVKMEVWIKVRPDSRGRTNTGTIQHIIEAALDANGWDPIAEISYVAYQEP